MYFNTNLFDGISEGLLSHCCRERTCVLIENKNIDVVIKSSPKLNLLDRSNFYSRARIEIERNFRKFSHKIETNVISN